VCALDLLNVSFSHHHRIINTKGSRGINTFYMAMVYVNQMDKPR